VQASWRDDRGQGVDSERMTCGDQRVVRPCATQRRERLAGVGGERSHSHRTRFVFEASA